MTAASDLNNINDMPGPLPNIIVVIIALFLPALLSAQPQMILLEGAVFRMGDSTGDADERAVHSVRLSDFYLARTETTVAEFGAFVRASGYSSDAERGEGSYVWDSLGWHKQEGVNWRHTETGRERTGDDAGNFPVAHVSWNDAAHYCNWLSLEAGLKPAYEFREDTFFRFYPDANGYRLPTEAEWEYAARGGKAGGKNRSGSLGAFAWYSGNAGRHAHPVASKKPDAAGFFDLCGNVWEWCHDRYAADYYSRSADARAPQGPETGASRCLRGGSWNNSGKHLRSSNRSNRYPDFRDGSVGFRVARRK